MASDHRFTDYLEFLYDLGATETPHFLEGGQAVNFWAEYFSAKNSGVRLAPFRPFTSKDCDIWVSLAALRHIEDRAEKGKLVKGDSPVDGQLGILTLNGPDPLTIDLMTGVYGIPQAKLKRVIERSIVVNGIRVMDPISLFQSKCHCLLGLDQAGRQDEKHVRILCALLPEHFEEALADTIENRASERALINELKFLQKILKRSRIKLALEQIEVEPMSLIPIEDLTDCKLTKVMRFAEATYGPAD